MTLTSIIQLITTIIGATIPVALGIALLAFFWGIFQAFGKMDSVDKRAEARQAIFWSAIALFVIVTLGGIIALFTSTFPGLGGGGGGGSTFTTPTTGGASGNPSSSTGGSGSGTLCVRFNDQLVCE
jgi:hypothetical protein